MAELTTPTIKRFETPFYYSDELERAIEEFKRDISKYYCFGYTYKHVLRNSKIKKVNAYLLKKFSKEDGSSNFPYLKRFVDYVYTRDEAINPFGKWYSFYYLEPLKILEFAQSLRLKSELKQVSLDKWASLIFLLFQLENITSFENIKKLRSKLQYLKSNYPKEWTNNQEKVWQNLLKSNIYSNRTILISSPDDFYNRIGFADYRPSKINAKHVNVRFDHYKHIRVDGFRSILLIQGVESLRKQFNDFVKQNEDRYNEMQLSLERIVDSGIILDSHLKKNVNYLYEELFIRDHSKYYFNRYLTNNPLIRIRNYDSKFYCSIQSSFYNFSYLLASLYTYKGNLRNQIKKPLGGNITESVREIILNAGRDNYETNINLMISPYLNKIHRITTSSRPPPRPNA